MNIAAVKFDDMIGFSFCAVCPSTEPAGSFHVLDLSVGAVLGVYALLVLFELFHFRCQCHIVIGGLSEFGEIRRQCSSRYNNTV